MSGSEWHPALTHKPGFLLGDKGKSRCVRADPASPKARPAKHRVFPLALRPTRSLSAVRVPEEGNWRSQHYAATVPRGDAHKRSGRVSTVPQKDQGTAVMVQGFHAGKQTGQTMEPCVGDCEGRQLRRKAPSTDIGVAACPALLHTLPAPPSINWQTSQPNTMG